MIVNAINNNVEKKKVSEKISLGKLSEIIRSGIEGPCNINNFSTVNQSEIGAYFGLGSFSYVTRAIIGRYCSFASRVSIGAANHPLDALSTHEFVYKDINSQFGESFHSGGAVTPIQKSLWKIRTKIGNDVFIGDNAVVLSGRSIGDGAVIGAGSVVTKDIEPYSIVVGNPAKKIRLRFTKEEIRLLLESRWWEYSIDDLKEIRSNNESNKNEFIRQYLRNL